MRVLPRPLMCVTGAVMMATPLWAGRQGEQTALDGDAPGGGGFRTGRVGRNDPQLRAQVRLFVQESIQLLKHNSTWMINTILQSEKDT